MINDTEADKIAAAVVDKIFDKLWMYLFAVAWIYIAIDEIRKRLEPPLTYVAYGAVGAIGTWLYVRHLNRRSKPWVNPFP